MLKIISITLVSLIAFSTQVYGAATFLPDAAEKAAIDPNKMNAQERDNYCKSNGYRQLSCGEPYMTNQFCQADSRYADKCICKPQYDKTCSETNGLRGKGTKCEDKYAECCNFTCSNPAASLIPCETKGWIEIQSEREDNECGQPCYLCISPSSGAPSGRDTNSDQLEVSPTVP